MRTWIYGDGYVVLRGSYEGICVEAAYGEIMIHSTEAVLGDVSLEKVVGVSS